MKTTTLLLAATAFLATQAVNAAEMQTTRSAGAHPVVHTDYPASELVLEVGNGILLTVTGEARTRFEWVENTVDFSSAGTSSSSDDGYFDDEYYYAPARFNLGFRVDLPRDVAMVLELQSGFDFGDEGRREDTQDINHSLLPGGTYLNGNREDHGEDNSDGVYVYQGYIEAAHIGDTIFSMRFGRQELAYGTEFILGNRDFYDGSSYDGIKGIFDFSDNSRLDLFWMKMNESNLGSFSPGHSYDVAGDNDTNLYGAYFSTQSVSGSSVGLDAYLIGVHDQANGGMLVNTLGDGAFGSFSDSWDSEGTAREERYTVGVRAFREAAHGWHWSAELAYQFGDLEGALNDSDGDLHEDFDIAALAFEGFLGYTWDKNYNPGIHVGFTFAEGTSYGDVDNGNSHTFVNSMGDIHPRLGLADMIAPSNVVAWNIGYTGSTGNHSWGVDLIHAEFDEADPWVSASALSGSDSDALAHGLDDEIGDELDLWYNYQYSRNLSAQFALAYFNPGNYYEEWNRCRWNDCEGSDLDPEYDEDVIHTSDAWRLYANLLLRF